jgi:hypothetical protein
MFIPTQPQWRMALAIQIFPQRCNLTTDAEKVQRAAAAFQALGIATEPASRLAVHRAARQ